VVRLKAGAFLVFFCGPPFVAGCVVGHVVDKPYSYRATKACLSGKAKLVSGGYFVVDSSGGGLEVRRRGHHDLYLDFGMSPKEARALAKEVKTHAPYGSGTVNTKGNVAYWTDDPVLTSADRKFVAGCLR
jgi:hypothetical protein